MSQMTRPGTVFGWPSVRGELDRAFRDVYGENGAASYFAPVTLWESEEHLYAELDLPGFAIEDLDITLEKGLLKISGERKMRDDQGQLHTNERHFGRFERTFRVSDIVDPESVDAEYANGVLCLTLKKRAEAKPTRIQIKGGGSTD